MHKPSKILPLALAAACASGPEPGPTPTLQAAHRPSATDHLVASLPPAKLLPATDHQRKIDDLIDAHFGRAASTRGYVMTDKPLYQPGETVWFRTDVIAASTLTAAGARGTTVQLVSPRGAVAAEKRVLAQGGVAANDLELPPELDGGEYTLRVSVDGGGAVERKIIVNTYEAPRLKKELELLRKAYGAGDAVVASLKIARATGEPFAGKSVTAVATVDDAEVARLPVALDAAGNGTVRFTLPAAIARGDGLLTVLVPDGGVTESIQKRIPILLKTVDVALYPEGGDLVEGLPGRVYLAATNSLGKPADVEGRVVDDRGDAVASFTSLHDGMARFDLTPAAGRAYRVEITRPAGIARTFELPSAKQAGCVRRAVDDVDGQRAAVDVAAWCTEAQTLTVEAVLREKRIASAAVDVPSRRPVRVSLPVDAAAQGAVRVTFFDAKDRPLAERLVYRGRGRDLKVEISADRKSYAPRDPVTLSVKTTDLAGKPVRASLGLAVVDDTVLSFADDKSARILAALYLEPELGGPVEEPNFYFSDKPEAAASLDLLMGTRGWRRFDWQLAFAPPPRETDAEEYDMVLAEAAPADEAPRPARRPRPAPAKPAAVAPAPEPQAAPAQEKNKEAKKQLAQPLGRLARGPVAGARAIRADDRDDFRGERERRVAEWAPVRVFPAPRYDGKHTGPRSDFRETIHWAPAVDTGEDGVAKVTFYLSDAVTSFRAVVEGRSAGGLPGRGEAVVQSKMPLSLDVRMPVEVSAGDKISLPVVLSNETDRPIRADLTTAFGSAFKLAENPVSGQVTLAAGERRSFFYPLTVEATAGEADVLVALEAEGLRDEIKKKIRVVPLGFPFYVSHSGTLDGAKRHTLSLGGALPGTVHASITLYPSPLATMQQGLQGMIREPGGCFEQTSSSNYPNVMIMSYLGATDGADAELVARTQQTLDRGYKLLTGYETRQKGYEWFGETPGHEALTAYGLMEFEDMARVYDVDRAMIERTAAWLMSRRDGKGGFLRNARALDSFGAASAPTTDAYIMWALSEARRTKGMDVELAAQQKRGLESTDPYLVALAANIALNVAPSAPETAATVKRLLAMQARDGSFPGAKESITRSGGEALLIETTALAGLAFIKSGHENELRAVVDWLNAHRGGYGEWGSTQSTILSLKTLTAYADRSRAMAEGGTAILVVNGREAGRIAFARGRKEAIVFEDFASQLVAGDNTIELRLDGGARLPYAVAVEYRAARPQSSEAAKVAVATTLARAQVKMGEGVKLRARVENRSEDGVPMTLARVGIPGGLVFQTWQLKELRDKGLIDFYETRPREVILYWRALPPRAVKEIDVELLAAVPGSYTAPATSAYLYYTDEDKAWVAPETVTVTR
jgi:hypothetical protein